MGSAPDDSGLCPMRTVGGLSEYGVAWGQRGASHSGATSWRKSPQRIRDIDMGGDGISQALVFMLPSLL